MLNITKHLIPNTNQLHKFYSTWCVIAMTVLQVLNTSWTEYSSLISTEYHNLITVGLGVLTITVRTLKQEQLKQGGK